MSYKQRWSVPVMTIRSTAERRTRLAACHDSIFCECKPRGRVGIHALVLQGTILVNNVVERQACTWIAREHTRTGGNIGILARGSTGCLTLPSLESSAKLSCDSVCPFASVPDSARWSARGDETDPLWAVDSYIVSISSQAIIESWGSSGWLELTARGRCNMPTPKSQRHNRPSSPTLPKR